MFIRITYRWGKASMKVLHSYRKDGKSKHYLIATFKNYDKERYFKIKEALKDWKIMSRAPVVIAEVNKIDPAKKTKRSKNIRIPKKKFF
ncbi:MAG: hypothetical protein ACYDIA_01355 [Candidatus Humimicrobiaceae bacterium]